MHTPYGATEALPVASIAASEVLGETAAQTAPGAGVCVGPPFPRHPLEGDPHRRWPDPLAGRGRGTAAAARSAN